MLEEGRIPIYEPGLDVLVERHRSAGRLSFTTDLAAAIDGAEAVFIGVGTPSRRGDGHADLTYVFAAAEEIAASLEAPDPGRDQVDRAGRHRPQAAEDLRHAAPRPARSTSPPTRSSCARARRSRTSCAPTASSAASRATGRARCCPAATGRLNLIETPILFTTLETAELIKYATNAFLATKITFINEVADLCERVGADVQQVAKGMGLDGRIGKKFLHAGPGYGGSCFPKDTLALLRTGEQHNTHLRIVEAVVGVNEGRKRRMVRKITDACGGSVAGKTIAVLGVTFKPGTDDMRESPSLVIVPALQGEGATVRAFDPEGMARGRASCCPTSTGARTPTTALEGADAAVILTEWNEFRGLDLDRAREVMRAPGADRPAQHLRPGPGRGRRLRLHQHRPADRPRPATSERAWPAARASTRRCCASTTSAASSAPRCTPPTRAPSARPSAPWSWPPAAGRWCWAMTAG